MIRAGNMPSDEKGGCICYPHTDRRSCYELRYYGYSPVMRDESEHSEGAFLPVDPDGECGCWCHESEDSDDDY